MDLLNGMLCCNMFMVRLLSMLMNRIRMLVMVLLWMNLLVLFIVL